MLSVSQLILVAVAAVAAGLVNAIAGGGTLITFPALLATGMPPIAANITSTVALCPGFLGALLAQRDDLRGQKSRIVKFVPAAMLGGICGGILLLNTSDKVFRGLVPFLLLLACLLLASQDRVRTWLSTRRHPTRGTEHWAILPIGIGAIYGGYFGAGLSVIILAVLGLLLDDSLTRLNALKQVLSFSINLAAALFLLSSGQVVWPAAIVMIAGALVGGAIGGRLAGRIKAAVLRRLVIGIGLIIAGIYLVRLWT